MNHQLRLLLFKESTLQEGPVEDLLSGQLEDVVEVVQGHWWRREVLGPFLPLEHLRKLAVGSEVVQGGVEGIPDQLVMVLLELGCELA